MKSSLKKSKSAQSISLEDFVESQEIYEQTQKATSGEKLKINTFFSTIKNSNSNDLEKNIFTATTPKILTKAKLITPTTSDNDIGMMSDDDADNLDNLNSNDNLDTNSNINNFKRRSF